METIEKDFNFDVAPTDDIDSGLENDEQLIEDEFKRYFYNKKKIK